MKYRNFVLSQNVLAAGFAAFSLVLIACAMEMHRRRQSATDSFELEAGEPERRVVRRVRAGSV